MFKIRICGRSVRVRRVTGIPVLPPVRGPCRGFGRAQRWRLLHAVNELRPGGELWLATLTYPACFDVQWREWKRHLRRFEKALFRHDPEASFVWRLEFQKRGAPHFHLILRLSGVVADLRGFVSAAWFRSVGSGDLRHLRAGTQVERLRSERGVFAYVAKYCAKMDGINSASGRSWGICGRRRWSAPLRQMELSDRDGHRLARTLRKMVRSQGFSPRAAGCGINCFASEAVLRLLPPGR